ncbi:MAG: hypothetical protein AB1486_14055 [Planctomycetota bacterium]
MAERGRERLCFHDLSSYLFLTNGNYLYKVPFRGGWAVLKVYYGNRSWLRYAVKTLGNVLVCNQTSFMPRARRATELACLKLWREAGFRVFDVYEDVLVEGLPEDGWALYEFVPGRKFVDYFGDRSIPLEERLAMWRRFLAEWCRRHELAIARREPRLVHENGDLKHVMIWKDELVNFDFEMCFRSRRRVKEFVAREILSYLKSLGKTVGTELWDTFARETVRHYPRRDLLEYTYAFAYRNPNPLLRLARWLDRLVKPRARKRFSKYSVARKLRDLLDAS